MSVVAIAPPYVARWRSDEGCFTVIVVPDRKRLRIVQQGYPVVARSVPRTEERHLVPIDYPVKRAVRSVRKFARNNCCDRVRHLLDALVRA